MRAILKLRLAAATAAALTVLGCDELIDPTTETLTTGELLILPLQRAAPPVAPTTFYVVNSRTVSRTILHPDNFNTLFARVEFPAGSVASLNGVAVGPADSVLVTVQPRPGQYGVTISPDGMEFSPTGRPQITFSFGVYADRSIADASGTYPDRDAYSDALEIWREVGLDLWTIAAGSAPAGFDAVRATTETTGQFVLAAPR